jgi:hypothetical protein
VSVRGRGALFWLAAEEEEEEVMTLMAGPAVSDTGAVTEARTAARDIEAATAEAAKSEVVGAVTVSGEATISAMTAGVEAIDGGGRHGGDEWCRRIVAAVCALRSRSFSAVGAVSRGNFSMSSTVIPFEIPFRPFL